MSSHHSWSNSAYILEGPINDDELEVEIEYDYTPGDPGCRTLRNGDPGWPPSPPEIEITNVWLHRKGSTKPEDKVDILPGLSYGAIEMIQTHMFEVHDDDI